MSRTLQTEERRRDDSLWCYARGHDYAGSGGAGLGVDHGRERAQASPPEPLKFRLEATVGIEPTIRVLQTPALTTWPRRLASAGAEEGI